MPQQDHWQTHPSYVSLPQKNHCANIGADDVSTFVNPHYAGSSQSYWPYTFPQETALPPPPPGMYIPHTLQPRRNTGYHIALAVLTVLVVVLGSLEVMQVVGHTQGVPYPSGTAGPKQAGSISALHTTAFQKASPVSIITPGTIKENVTLTCGGCDDPILTTITSITIDTTDLKTIWHVTLCNRSGVQQIDYFAAFNLQDPSGNTYKGTGALNSDFFLDAGKREIKTEIFSFLPRPGVSYTLVGRLGIAGITYDPIQITI
jgi:hypothetical protein